MVLLAIVAFIYSVDASTDGVMQRETYCTSCKANVIVADATYVRLANARAIIKGKCSSCGLELIKASIMPKSSALTSLRKKRRKKR
jgi:RNase P subunit RPR2